MIDQSIHAERIAPTAGRKTIGLSLILSAFFPPILLYVVWKTKSFRQRHWLLTLFVGWYAMSLPIVLNLSGEGSDGVRHLLSVYIHYTDMSFGKFMSDSWDIIRFKGAESSNDMFKHTLGYITGGVIGVPQLFFPVVGLVYGYFFSGSMLIIFRNLSKKRLPWVIIFIGLCFFFTRNIDSLQAVRNPTAGWMLVYGVLKFQETRKVRYIILMACTPLIHFSFLLIALPTFLYLVIGNRPLLYAVLFVFSTPMNLVTPDIANELISRVEIGQQKNNRTADERADLDDRAAALEQSVQGGTRFWRAYMMSGYHVYALNILVFGLIFSGAYFKMERVAQSVFSNGLLMLTASSALWFLVGATGRIWGVGLLLIMAGFFIWRLSNSFSLGNILFKKIYVVSCYTSAIIFIPYLMFHFSAFLDFLNVFAIALPWMSEIVPSANMPLKDFIRFILPF